MSPSPQKTAGEDEMVSVWQSAVRATRPRRRTLAWFNLVLASFSVGVLAFPASSFAKEEPTVNISILVYNYAKVAPGTLAGAEHQADRILNQAGVRAVWFDCSVKAGKLDEKSICRSGLGNQNIVLRLLSRHIPPEFQISHLELPCLLGWPASSTETLRLWPNDNNSPRSFHFS
jgi:hypothetical protein